MHKTMSLISLHTSRFIATPKHSEPLSPKNYICVVALSTDLLRVSLHVVIEFLHYSPTIELLLLLIPINRFYLSSAGLFTILEILISIVADTVRRFMQDRLAGRYLRTSQRRTHGKLLIIISRSFRKSCHGQQCITLLRLSYNMGTGLRNTRLVLLTWQRRESVARR